MAALILRQLEPAADLAAIAAARPGTVDKRAPEGLVLIALGPSICSQRVRLALLEKQLGFREYTINLWAGENLEPWYLDLNPRGVAPTLIESGRAVIDSATIMKFVDNQFAGPELMPRDERRHARALELIARADVFPIRDFAYRSVVERSRRQGRQDHWKTAMRDNVAAYRERFPAYRHLYDLKLADFDSMAATAVDADSMAELHRRLERTMDDLDERLAADEWLAGDSPTLADIAWLPILLRLHGDVGIEVHDERRRPNLHRFVEQWRRRPSFETGVRIPACYLDDLGDSVPPPPDIPGVQRAAGVSGRS